MYLSIFWFSGEKNHEFFTLTFSENVQTTILSCTELLFLGNGYITTNTLKEILREIDSNLTEYNLDQIVEEVDADGSGTIDFDEFMAMMTGDD